MRTGPSLKLKETPEDETVVRIGPVVFDWRQLNPITDV